jgi:DHA2 family multidrug resistance protein
MASTMYATLALLAPYLQTLMDYSVLTAGIALAPRGAGLMLAALVCGRMIGRISARLLIALGFIIGAGVLYAMTLWTPDVSEWSVISAGFLQGISVGFMTIPINILTFTTLPATLRTEGAGVYSLMRNLGSAIGISVTGALLQMNTQVNHAMIAAAVTPFNRALHAGSALRFWNPLSEHGAAMLNEVITRQASTIAYVDDFKLMFVLSAAVLPLLLLTRPAKAR